MQWITTIIVTFLCFSSFGDEGYRSFTDQQGRTIKAKLVSFDSKSGKVTVERENRKKVTVSPTIFSDVDQNFIRQWIKTFLLSDKRNFSFSVDERKGDWSEYKLFGDPISVSRRYTRFNETEFTIDLKNKSTIDFGTVRLQFCLFINRNGYGKIEDVMYCETGSVHQELKPLSTAKFQIEDIKVLERYREQSNHATDGPIEYFKTKEAIETIEGGIFRVYIDGSDRNDTFLEFSEPANFTSEHQWKEFRARAGKEKEGLLK